MTLSPKCAELVKRFEGCRLDAYPDPATGGEPITVGWGHTGPEVHLGMRVSQDIADGLLLKDLTHAADVVMRAVTLQPPVFTQGMLDALTSFVFNCGGENFRKSTLLRKLNAGDTLGASLEILKWTKAAGKEMPGLVRRRAAEQSLFLS
jgi:lysozyme